MISRLLTLNDLLSSYELFPKMGITNLTDADAKRLDGVLNLLHGNMPLSPSFRRMYVTTNETITEEIISSTNLTVLTSLLYMMHKTSWDKLLDFSTKEYNPLTTRTTKNIKEYGHTIDTTDGGSDETSSNNDVYGFDSTSPVPSDDNKVINNYGKTSKIVNGGTDVSTTDSQTDLTTSLWNTDLVFWDKHNVPIIMVDDVFNDICDSYYMDRDALEDRLVN